MVNATYVYIYIYIYTYLYIYIYPDAPCMEYLLTFGWFLGQMVVNIPYMEHMGYIVNT